MTESKLKEKNPTVSAIPIIKEEEEDVTLCPHCNVGQL